MTLPVEGKSVAEKPVVVEVEGGENGWLVGMSSDIVLNVIGICDM